MTPPVARPSPLARFTDQLRAWKGDSGPRWTFVAKLVVTVSLLGLLFWRIDVAESLRAIRDAFGVWLGLVLVTSVLLIGSSILKWRALLRSLGIDVSLWALFRLYTIGIFASSLLPGIIGGDIVRWQILGRRTGRSVEVAASILAERVSGVVAIVVLAPLAVVIDPTRLATPVVIVLLAGAAAAVFGGLALALNRRLAITIAYRTRRARLAGFLRPLYELHRTLRRFSAGVLWIAMGYSVLFYLFGGLYMFLLSRAFTVPLPFAASFSAQILVNLVGLLPVSLGGLGVLQAGDVYFLGLYAVSAESALGISLTKQLVQYGYGLLGAVFPLTGSVPGNDAAD